MATPTYTVEVRELDPLWVLVILMGLMWVNKQRG